MSTQVKPPPRLTHSGRRECGTQHSPPALDRRVAARICRHYSASGLHITITAGVATMSFHRPVSTVTRVRAMREVCRRTSAYHANNPLHRADLAVNA